MSEGFHLAPARGFLDEEPLGSAADPGGCSGAAGHCRWEGKPILMVIYHLSFSLK